MSSKMVWTHTPAALAALLYLIKRLVVDGQVCHLFKEQSSVLRELSCSVEDN